MTDRNSSKLTSLSTVLNAMQMDILTLKYRDRFTQAEIAEAMSLSQPTVSRMHDEAIKIIRERFGGDPEKLIVDIFE